MFFKAVPTYEGRVAIETKLTLRQKNRMSTWQQKFRFWRGQRAKNVFICDVGTRGTYLSLTFRTARFKRYIKIQFDVFVL